MSRAVEWVRRHPTPAFFLFTYAWSWTLWKAFDRLYLGGNVLALPFIMLGMFGPGLVGLGLSAALDPDPNLGDRRRVALAFAVAWLPAALLITLDQVLNEGRSARLSTVAMSAMAGLIPAVVVASAFSGVPGIRRHLATIRRPTGHAGYYALAISLFAAIWLIGVAVTRELGSPVQPRTLPPAAASIGVVGAVVLRFFYNVMPNALSEEVGWRGFALPRLQDRYSPLAASLVLWVFWAIWHGPAYLGGFVAQSLEDTLVEWVLVLPVAIVFTWFYNRTKGSLLVVALLHPAMNTATQFLPVTLAGLGLLLAFVAFAIVRDRMWRRLPVRP